MKAIAKQSIWLALILPLISTGALASRPAKARQQSSSSFSASKSMMESVNQAGLPPTKISLMPYRHAALQYAVTGYLRAKVPLVAFDGTKYLPAGFSDDPGIYYFIPRVAVWSGISVENAINLFFGAILLISFLTGAIGFLMILHRWPLKLWAVFALCMLLWFTYRKGDVYVALSAPVVAVVPWFLYALRKNAASAGMAAFLFIVGLLAGVAGQIRSYAATGLVTFIVILLAFGLKRSVGRKLTLVAALLVGMAVPPACFHSLIAQRDAFLTTAEPGYTRTVNQHPIWHTVYTGLGFRKNPYVAGYSDEVAADAVYAISPSTPYLSTEYERVLRDETFRIVREHPLFVAVTLLDKLRIILFLLLCWCNIGLPASAFYPKGWAMESAFWSALAFTSLFGIIAIPQIQYLLGFMAFATVYGLVSLEHALESRARGELHGTRRHQPTQTQTN